MAERGRARAGAGTRTWPLPGSIRRRATRWGIAEIPGELFARASQWARAEVAPGRLFPWLAVAFGAGIALYFTAPREPMLWAPVLLAVVLGLTVAARARPLALPILLGFAAAAAGFAAGTLRAQWVSHPVLRHFVSSAAISGWVEVRESRERTDRIVIRVDTIEGGGSRKRRAASASRSRRARRRRSGSSSSSRRGSIRRSRRSSRAATTSPATSRASARGH